MCFWDQFDPWAKQVMRVWSRVGRGEKVSEEHTNWAINWEAFREFRAAGHPDFTLPGEEEWELNDALQVVLVELSKTVEQRFLEREEE